MKTNALSGALLNFYAGRAAGLDVILVPLYGNVCECRTREGKPFDPANDWAQGGTLIDKFDIDVTKEPGEQYWGSVFHPGAVQSLTDGAMGRTRLEAAARAIVRWRYGDTVPGVCDV